MRILFILPRYHTNYIEVLNSLSKNGHKVKLCVYNYGLIEDYKFIKPIYITPSLLTKLLNFLFKFKLNKYYLPNIYYFNKMVSQFNPELVIIRPYSKFLTLLMLVLRIFKKFELIFYHQTDNKSLKKFNISLKFLKFYLLDKLLNIKSYSPLFNRSDKFFFKRLFYLPFVTNVIFKEKKNSKKYKFLMIGKFLEKKNHEMFVRGLKFLSKNFDIEGTIIGEVSTIDQKNEFNRIKKFVKKIGLEKKITILKNIPYKYINKFYYKNDFFVLPTNHDPAPFSILEAMSHGCMVLCSSSCGTKNYINKNFNGYIFENNNQSSLNKYMLKMIKNKKNFFNNHKKNHLIVQNSMGRSNFNLFFNKLINNKK